jgi:hypothetical protein
VHSENTSAEIQQRRLLAVQARNLAPELVGRFRSWRSLTGVTCASATTAELRAEERRVHPSCRRSADGYPVREALGKKRNSRPLSPARANRATSMVKRSRQRDAEQPKFRLMHDSQAHPVAHMYDKTSSRKLGSAGIERNTSN